MTTKRTVLLSLALILLASTASAADLTPKAQVRASATADPWNSFYGFLQVGVGQTKGNAQTDSYAGTPDVTTINKYPVQKCYTHSQEEGPPIEKCYNERHKYVFVPQTTPGIPGSPGSYAEDNIIGILAGAGIGVNKRLYPNLAVGAEFDGVYSWMNSYINGNGGTIQHRVPYILSLTARALYLPTSMPDFGVYAKGGLAIVKQQTSITGLADASQTKVGWTVGGGVEKQIPSLGASARLETMFVKVPDQVVPFSGGVSTQKGDIWTIKAMLSKPL